MTQTSNSGLQLLIDAIILICSQASDTCVIQLVQRLADVAFIEEYMSAKSEYCRLFDAMSKQLAPEQLRPNCSHYNREFSELKGDE